jgi:hypothetical protein
VQVLLQYMLVVPQMMLEVESSSALEMVCKVQVALFQSIRGLQ